MQIKDFFGLEIAHMPEHYLPKVAALAVALPGLNPGDAAIGIVTLGMLIIWPRLGIRLPGHLPALLAGCAVMGIVHLLGGNVATIGSRFHYLLADGTQGSGIPPLLPQLACNRGGIKTILRRHAAADSQRHGKRDGDNADGDAGNQVAAQPGNGIFFTPAGIHQRAEGKNLREILCVHDTSSMSSPSCK